MKKPVILITLAYIGGLLAGHGFLYFPYATGILIALCILTSGIAALFGKMSPRLFWLSAIPGIIGMAAYLFSSTWLPPNHYTRVFAYDNKMHEIAGTIASPLDRGQDRTGFVLKLSTVDGDPVSGDVRVSVRAEAAGVGYGDFIRITGKLLRPGGTGNPGGFDYSAYLARSGIYSLVSVKDFTMVEIAGTGKGFFRTVQDWREHIRRSFLASTTGAGSAILQAMIIGEEGLLTDEMRDSFMAAGATHIISISGSHLGMLAVLCFGFLRGIIFLMPERYYNRLTLHLDPKKAAAWLTLPCVAFYTLLAGCEVATIRSLIMITAGLLALILDRDDALMNSLAIAALLILIASPQAIFDISFQLSYFSVLAIGYVVTLWNDLEIRQEGVVRKIRNSIAMVIMISLTTSLATGPLVAHYFNQFSFAGIISNLVVIPFAGLFVVPLGLFSAVLSLCTGYLPLAGVDQFFGNAFVAVVEFFGRLSFAEMHPPAPDAVWLFFYFLFLFFLASAVRAGLRARFKPFESTTRVPRSAVLGAIISGCFLVLPLAVFSMPVRTAEVSFPDVGQGDCALIRLRSGKNILIDGGGTYDNRFDIGRRIVAPYLWNKGVSTIDLLILSHPHPDHMNGLRYILKKFRVLQVWESERDTDLPGYKEFRQIIAEKNIPRRTVSAEEQPAAIGEAELFVLHPAGTFISRDRQAYAAENSRSLVIKMVFDNRVSLFPGDIGSDAEQELAEKAPGIKCDLLKVPHHGSKSSSSELFISATRPHLAMMTVGRGNRYRHPSPEVLERYAAYGAEIGRTDIDGAVTVRMEKNGMNTVRWNDCVLERIDFFDRTAWGKREKSNWSRLQKRIQSDFFKI